MRLVSDTSCWYCSWLKVVEVDAPFPVLKLLPLESVAIPSLIIKVTFAGAEGAPDSLVGELFDIENELVASSYWTDVPGEEP